MLLKVSRYYILVFYKVSTIIFVFAIGALTREEEQNIKEQKDRGERVKLTKAEKKLVLLERELSFMSQFLISLQTRQLSHAMEKREKKIKREQKLEEVVIKQATTDFMGE